MSGTVQLVVIIGVVIVILFLLLLGVAVIIARFYKKVEQGKVLIVNKMKADPDVTFSGATVLPIVHKAEVMDISLKTIEINRRGQEGLICQDNVRADITVTFFVRVNKNKDDVLQVAQSVGCARASDQGTLEELFNAKFSEALKTVGKRMDFEDLYKERDRFKDDIIAVIGTDLNGYVLDDCAIDYLEQTPLESLDPQNILDSRGIRKITEITAGQNVLTNDLRQNERKQIKRQNVEADEAVFELERQRADAEAKQQREIATVRAKEAAETQKVAAEERSKAEQARIKAEEEIQVQDENKNRQIQVAQKNRERVIGIETERVEKDRMLEQITRERETELKRIQKEKDLEEEKKQIANVIRDRIAVEKNVAEEEERIKDLRAIKEAERTKSVVKITAEGEAEEKLVKEIKAAEAQEQCAVHEAKRRLTLAEAALEAADKEAQAKIRIAEGVQAEEAASGLAACKVKEADALATEKQGLAQVRVKEADALAIEKQGLAGVHIKEADADATRKLGLAEAEITREQLLSEAAGAQEKGMADVRIKEAEAGAIEKRGLAEATAVREKLFAEADATQKQGMAEATATREKWLAEANGIAEKAEAMKALDGVGREHEEFRLKLDKAKIIELQSINTRRDIAQAQAEVMGKAMENAKVNIVGGDGEFFDKFVNAVTLGHSIDGAIDSSDTLKTTLKEYLDGKANLPDDIKQILSQPAVGAEGIQRLTLSAVLGKLLLTAKAEDKGKIKSLLDKARDLGIDQISSK